MTLPSSTDSIPIPTARPNLVSGRLSGFVTYDEMNARFAAITARLDVTESGNEGRFVKLERCRQNPDWSLVVLAVFPALACIVAVLVLQVSTLANMRSIIAAETRPASAAARTDQP